MSTYLVTGGAGFIGSHLCDALVARGDSVRVLDDLSTGHRHNLPPGVPLIVGDVADPAAVAEAIDGVDGCFHLAAIASVEKGVTDWLGTHRANITGTITVFDAIRRQGSRIPVVYASSAAVYGDAATVPDRRNRAAHAAVGLRRGQVRLRTARPRRQPRPWHSHRGPALLQRLRPAAGPEIALLRRDLDLLRADRRGRADQHLRRRRPDARFRLCRRRGRRPARRHGAAADRMRRSSTSAPASRPRCRRWRR